MVIAIVDERISPAAMAELSELGFCVFALPRCERLPEATASHPDMLVFRLGRELFVEARYYEENQALFAKLKKSLPFIDIRSVRLPLGSEYPRDCALNVLHMGERIFVKSDSVAPEILSAAGELGIKTVSVKQGYPACTVLALGKSHAITADRGMARALRDEGIKVLLIDNGDISLPPHEYGFIGGAAGVFGGKVYFLGDLNEHRQSDEICAFCRAAGYEPVSVDRGILRDLGRILFINSEENYQ